MALTCQHGTYRNCRRSAKMDGFKNRCARCMIGLPRRLLHPSLQTHRRRSRHWKDLLKPMVHYRSILAFLGALTFALCVAPGVAQASANSGAHVEDRAQTHEQGGLLDTITGNRGSQGSNQQQATPAPTIAVTVVTPTPAATTIPTTTAPTSTTIPATTTTGTTDPDVIANPEGIIEGTVVANRSGAVVRFFVEGKTWQLDPLRSAGIALSRPTAVLNLFNCDVNTSAAQEDCFWDPYLLERDGFFEIVPGAEENADVSLVLRAAGAPPANQIWIQNRSGKEEQLYFGAEMVDLAPASVHEFAIEPTSPSVFYLRTCVDGATGTVCEWTARETQPGTYYALVSESWQSGLPGVTVTDMQLAPVLGTEVAAPALTATPAAATVASTETITAATTDAGAAAPVPAAAPATTSGIVCRLAVPTLNVRSGPGLEFAVIGKIMTTGETPATVTVVGRTETGEWLQVDERQANGGWIINGDAYVTCDASTATLAAVPASLLPATPTPDPALAVAPAPSGDGGSVSETIPEDGSAEATTEDGGESAPVAPQPSGAPAGLALLVVQNSFEQPLRFTLDQRYRVAEGPSEVDLAPGQSTSYIVYPGVIAFSASSAWRSLSGNAEILLEADQQHPLYLIFVPDPGEEGKWIFQH